MFILLLSFPFRDIVWLNRLPTLWGHGTIGSSVVVFLGHPAGLIHPLLPLVEDHHDLLLDAALLMLHKVGKDNKLPTAVATDVDITNNFIVFVRVHGI